MSAESTPDLPCLVRGAFDANIVVNQCFFNREASLGASRGLPQSWAEAERLYRATHLLMQVPTAFRTRPRWGTFSLFDGGAWRRLNASAA
jgi:hypothetical protein